MLIVETNAVVPADNHKGCAGPGSSPVVVLNNTMGWIPASAGMTNHFEFLSRINVVLNNMDCYRLIPALRIGTFISSGLISRTSSGTAQASNGSTLILKWYITCSA